MPRPQIPCRSARLPAHRRGCPCTECTDLSYGASFGRRDNSMGGEAFRTRYHSYVDDIARGRHRTSAPPRAGGRPNVLTTSTRHRTDVPGPCVCVAIGGETAGDERRRTSATGADVSEQANDEPRTSVASLTEAQKRTCRCVKQGANGTDKDGGANGRGSTDRDGGANGRGSTDRDGGATGRGSTDRDGGATGRGSTDRDGGANGRGSTDRDGGANGTGSGRGGGGSGRRGGANGRGGKDKDGGANGKGGKDKDNRNGCRAISKPRPVCLGNFSQDSDSLDGEYENEGVEITEETAENASGDPGSQIVKRESMEPMPYFPQDSDEDAGGEGESDDGADTGMSLSQWRRNNLATFQKAAGDSQRASLVDFNARSTMEETLAVAPRNQREVTERLQQRNAEVKRWIPEIDNARQSLWQEIQNLMKEEDRLRRVLCAMEKIIHIVNECLQIRSTRMESERCKDEVDEQLCKELGVANEIREMLEGAKEQIKEQLEASRESKRLIEQDLSDKTLAVAIDSENIQYTIHSPSIMFYPGAEQPPEDQSTLEDWENGTRENIMLSESERAKICTLRAFIDTVVSDSARNMAAQKIAVDDALAKNIELTSALATNLEEQLKNTLRDTLTMERLLSDIKDALRKFDFPLKKAQTRLHNREARPRLENTQDPAQLGLVDEVNSITEQSSILMGQLSEVEDALAALQDSRRLLEREIQAKRKTLFIDRDRIKQVRLHYPLADSLMVRALSQCEACR